MQMFINLTDIERGGFEAAIWSRFFIKKMLEKNAGASKIDHVVKFLTKSETFDR